MKRGISKVLQMLIVVLILVLFDLFGLFADTCVVCFIEIRKFVYFMK